MENKTWTYADRYRHIKEVKIRHTEEKRIQQGGFMNADDYGNVPLPEDYHFTPIPAETLSVIQAGRRILPLCWRFIPFMWIQLRFCAAAGETS